MRDLWVIDWKSSTGIWDEMKTQVSCYARMGGMHADRAGIVRLDKITGKLDDPPLLEVMDIDIRWEAFKSLRQYYKLMVEPNAKTDHFYTDNGKRLPSPTGILDILNKPALIQWSANLTIDYFKGIVKPFKDEYGDEFLGLKTTEWDYHFKAAKTAFRKKSKEAMDIGSIVHDAVHARLSGMSEDEVLQTIIRDNELVFNSVSAFLRWKDEVGLEPIGLEKILIDSEIGIGGTVDFIGYLSV